MAFIQIAQRDRLASRRRLTGARKQLRIIHALMIREALGRYGHENLGFFWIIAEPLAFTTGIMVLWSLAKLSHGGEVDVIPFALTGYSFITMWRHITGRAQGAIRQHVSMSYHRGIRPIHCVVAMAVLEIVACFSAFIVAYLPLWLFGLCPPLSDPFALIMGYALTGVFSLGFGLFLAGLCQTSEVVHHIIPALMYISIPATGIFSMQAWLPQHVRQILSWSPLVNGMEMFRSGLFPPTVPAEWDGCYLVECSFFSLAVGIIVFLRCEQRNS